MFANSRAPSTHTDVLLSVRKRRAPKGKHPSRVVCPHTRPFESPPGHCPPSLPPSLLLSHAQLQQSAINTDLILDHTILLRPPFHFILTSHPASLSFSPSSIPQPMLPPQDSHGDTQAHGSSPFTKGGIKAKRNYRTKARDMDSDSDTAPEPTLSNDTATTTKPTKKTSLPYVESQNAQNLGEVYPGLARLSFLDQAEQEIDEQQQQQQHKLLQKIPRAQSDQPHFTPPQRSHDPLAQEGSTSDAQNRVVQPATSPSPVPTLTPPSVLFAGSPTSLVEIRDTGSATKGRGLFSAARETLKPGTLLFKELGYCQVVNDESLSQVCSACFKDTREEQGEDDKAASGLPNGGQRKLVRCAGCKVVWYCNKVCGHF